MPTTNIQPYLFFSGRCEEALEFYKSAIGAEVEMVMRFNESPDPVPNDKLQPGFEKKIMHSSFKVNGNVIMASDGCNDQGGFKGFSLVLTVDSEEAAHRAFNALSAKGKINMSLTKTFWSPCYGMLSDPFGVEWMIMVPGEIK